MQSSESTVRLQMNEFFQEKTPMSPLPKSRILPATHGSPSCTVPVIIPNRKTVQVCLLLNFKYMGKYTIYIFRCVWLLMLNIVCETHPCCM